MSIEDRFERIEEKYDGVKELIILGKEKGYLLYDEVNDVLPDDINSSKDLDSIFYLFGDAGIEVIDSEQQLEVVKRKARSKSTDEDGSPDPASETLEKTNDPVRMYLREMGTVPLLTRQGEVEIAKRIEKGQKSVIKALSRSPVVVGEISKYGKKLREHSLVGLTIFLDPTQSLSEFRGFPFQGGDFIDAPQHQPTPLRQDFIR